MHCPTCGDRVSSVRADDAPRRSERPIPRTRRVVNHYRSGKLCPGSGTIVRAPLPRNAEVTGTCEGVSPTEPCPSTAPARRRLPGERVGCLRCYHKHWRRTSRARTANASRRRRKP